MCGIAGELSFKAGRPDKNSLLRMRELLRRRGPDGEGEYFSGPLGLVHRRLAIVDPGPGGHQPMVHSGSGDALVYNGEIYNHLELKEALVRDGAVFSGRCDTEVLLEGLHRYGLDFVPKLNGQFAFAYWRQSTQELFLVRDRMGIKPLYLFQDSRRVLFASEVKALLAAGVSAEVEEEALDSYLALRYVRGRKTIFKGITKLRPGTYLRLRADGRQEEGAYWKLQPDFRIKKPEELRDRFERAVKSRLMADVPLGAFLSGGIDSSAIACFLPPATGTWSYRMEGSPEAEQAEALSKRLKLDFHLCEHDPGLFEDSRHVLELLEEPVGDSIPLAYSRIFRAAGRKVKAALTGEGADEVFGGYVHQQMAFGLGLMPGLLKHVSRYALGRFPRIADRLIPYPAALGDEMVERGKRALGSREPWEIHLAMVELWTEEERKSLLGSSITSSLMEFQRREWPEEGNEDLFLQFLRFDLKFWLPDYSLLRTDKLSMGWGLEVRTPYLDHEFVSAVLGFLGNSGPGWKRNKRLLRFFMADLLPPDSRSRPKHPFFLDARGFSPAYRSYLSEALAPGRLKKYGYLDPAAAGKLLDGKRGFLAEKKLTSLLHFQLWCERFLG